MSQTLVWDPAAQIALTTVESLPGEHNEITNCKSPIDRPFEPSSFF